MKIIYGIIDTPTIVGVQAYAIDGDSGQVIESHFCSNESFAKDDLGFSDDPCKASSRFAQRRKQKYDSLYPNGYKLRWIGDWKENAMITKLREGTEVQPIKTE